MCGIFAYLNYQSPKTRRYILHTLLKGLKHLEYKGCDSSGLAIDDDGFQQGVPVIVKCVGPVANLEKLIQNTKLNFERSFETHTAIGHTRWATHGAPSEINAHPQTSDEGNDFVVVHNGIVTNYAALRQLLESRGMSFTSETDTEAIAKLCQYVYKSHSKMGFLELAAEVIQQLEGAFGIVIKSRHFPDELIACQRGSPLLCGIKYQNGSFSRQLCLDIETQSLPKEIFISSDAAALVEHCTSVVYLEDDDIVHIVDGQILAYNPITEGRVSPRVPEPQHTNSPSKSGFSRRLELTSREPSLLKAELDNIMKGNYPHFMLKEIYEQPHSLRNCMRGRINFSHGTVKLGGIVPHIRTISRARRILFFGVNSAYYGALAVRNTLEELIDIPISVELAVDYPDRTPPIFRDDVCCFISFTGENQAVIDVLQYCKGKGAFCVGITNQVGSTVAKESHCGCYLHAGFEVGSTATKIYGNCIVTLLMFGLVVSEDNNQTATKRAAIVSALQQLPDQVANTLSSLGSTMKEVAEEFKDSRNFLVMGRGCQSATSLEGALKLKEVALVHSEGIHFGELKHGPLALVDENMPVVAICTKESSTVGGNINEENDPLYPKVKSSLQQVLARHGRPIVITHDDKDIGADNIHKKVIVPLTLGCLQTVINVIPLQLLTKSLLKKK